LRCYNTQSFHIITAREEAQSFCKMTELGHESFFDVTVLDHFSLLQYSVIFYCYGARRFAMLQSQLFLVVTACEAAQSFYKMIELGRGCVRATCGSITAARG
jgi:hypothetical protein